MNWVTTTILLDRLRDFEDATWEVFAERFRGPIVNFAARAGLHEEAAQDVAQSTLLAFAEAYRADRYDRDRGRLSSWLFGIAWKEVLNARRTLGRDAGRAPAVRTGVLDGVADEASARRTWDDEWKHVILRRCLEQVKEEVEPATYDAFEQVALRHRSPADVAEALGLTRNAVFIAKHRVLKRLRELQDDLESVG